ncbi:MAG TPA: 4-alpha-glucanotransferase [Solirubrobacteraceae bacterium]
MTTDAWGITDGFHDTAGGWHSTSAQTRAAIRRAMGDADAEAPPPSSVRVVRQGASPELDGPAELTLEDGAVLRVTDRLAADLPTGYHQIRPLDDARPSRLIVAPHRCHLPDGLRIWGWAAQLYATRSTQSWGIGDLADLHRLARWSSSLGAGMLLINPLSAATPVAPLQPSPYYASSRRFRNPLFLSVEEVPGARTAGVDLERLAATGRVLNEERRIDRDAVWKLKGAALEKLWAAFAGSDRFDRYRAEQGRALREFATFCTLAEQHGAGWQGWPAEYRRPESAAVARFAAERAERVGYHEWLQWLIDEQLARASRELRLMQDLPIGVDPGGADAWAWQDAVTTDASVGAPPDAYNTGGQDWGLPPFVPYRLAADGYTPFIETIRAGLRHAGGLRIDHVMGLFRLFWIPKGLTPAEGAYIRYPADDLLAIVALESQRAGAIIVGEDLGTVEAGVRERLAEQAILSYRVMWFQPEPPEKYPELALAAVTTHDLPTIAGLWTGADVEAQAAIGREPNRAAFGEMRERLRQMIDVNGDAPVPEVIERTHDRLAQAPSIVVTATLDDALAVPERPNMPGTVTEWPNWAIALPLPLEAIEGERLPQVIAGTLARSRPRASSQGDAGRAV